MFLSLLAIAIPVEGLSNLSGGLRILIAAKGPFFGPIILIFPGAIAFCMTSSEFALLKRTSVVTLSICGIFKEVVTIIAAGAVFHDKLTLINLSGLFITIASIATYNYIKIMKMREEARKEAHINHLGHSSDPNSTSGIGTSTESARLLADDDAMHKNEQNTAQGASSSNANQSLIASDPRVEASGSASETLNPRRTSPVKNGDNHDR